MGALGDGIAALHVVKQPGVLCPAHRGGHCIAVFPYPQHRLALIHEMGHRTYVLDGDNVRHGLNKDLGFTQEDRVENIRRVAEVAKLMVDAGLIVLTTFISPYRADREMARALFQEGEFFEVFIDTPLEVCEQRDPKGLYKKARKGEIKNFTGLDSSYEAPDHPDLTINAHSHTVEEATALLCKLIS